MPWKLWKTRESVDAFVATLKEAGYTVERVQPILDVPPGARDRITRYDILVEEAGWFVSPDQWAEVMGTCECGGVIPRPDPITGGQAVRCITCQEARMPDASPADWVGAYARGW